ncbi:transcriptional elongation regulator (Elongin C), putative [Cordyceps militaris CM01]|uniref:Elongin-C n=1 Tax=Cordyceps militaris (strain CM01) TaxID=983644 RepID=G3JEJ9_CORMM|nr:transcriptional elongation regulator (Elongin C), putative [Cordyceps militaris CM01]EGX93396.1 transcriptional elongation regulator (Elongin C), putative [Cordyceps militaris CM01]
MATIQTPSKYVTLVSGDGFEFVVLREATMISPIIKGMLEPRKNAYQEPMRCRPIRRGQRSKVYFPRDENRHVIDGGWFCSIFASSLEINCVELTWSANSAVVLDKVVEYFHYWYRYRNSEDVPDMDIPVEICLEVLAAADYLGMDQ